MERQALASSYFFLKEKGPETPSLTCLSYKPAALHDGTPSLPKLRWARGMLPEGTENGVSKKGGWRRGTARV